MKDVNMTLIRNILVISLLSLMVGVMILPHPSKASVHPSQFVVTAEDENAIIHNLFPGSKRAAKPGDIELNVAGVDVIIVPPPPNEPTIVDDVGQLILTQTHKKEIECLAKMAYHEARGSEQGVKDVIDVMFNRIKHSKFPSTVCENIALKKQYAWFGKKLKIKELETWEKVKHIAKAKYVKFTKNEWKDGTGGAISFNPDKSMPTKTAKLLFYREGHWFYK